MIDLLDMLWPFGLFFGALCLFAAYATKNAKQGDYLEDAYKWAPGGGLVILASAIIMWILRVQPYWYSLSVSN